MKISIDIDCTPQEARAFLGLPDVAEMQQRLLAALEARMGDAIQKMDPEAMMRQWMPLGLEGMEQIQRFWSGLAGMDRKPGRDTGGQG